MFAIDWTNQLLHGNLFSHVFVDDRGAHGLVDVLANDFGSFVEIEGKTFKSMLKSLPQHDGLGCNFCFAKIIALQLATFTRDSVSMVALCGGASFYMCFSCSS